MIIFLLLLAAGILTGTALRLPPLVMGDGLGPTRPPRSHRAELGSWIDRALQR